MTQSIHVRYDERADELVVSLSIPNLRDFEVRDKMLWKALLDLSEELENEGV